MARWTTARLAEANFAPPRVCADHVLDYAARLRALPATTAIHYVRNSAGEMRMVQKLGAGYYIVGGREAYSAYEAAQLVEGESNGR